jgi:hypothetical protein
MLTTWKHLIGWLIALLLVTACMWIRGGGEMVMLYGILAVFVAGAMFGAWVVRGYK